VDVGQTEWMVPAQDALARRFDSYRTHLLAVGYRLTSSMADAEDAVQEAWLRLSGVDADHIEDLRAWLTTVVGRICLDKLRSAPARRERYVGQWLPEPVVTTATDPMDLVIRDTEVRMAALGCAEAAARQHASRVGAAWLRPTRRRVTPIPSSRSSSSGSWWRWPPATFPRCWPCCTRRSP